jgi:hypothetical protein
MCLVCSEWLKGNLTTKEAFRNLGETIGPESTDEDIDHYWDTVRKLMDEEDHE